MYDVTSCSITISSWLWLGTRLGTWQSKKHHTSVTTIL